MSERMTEAKMRKKFRDEAAASPQVLVGQYVNLTISGPSYKVLEVKQASPYVNVVNATLYWYAHLSNYKSGAYFAGAHHPGWIYISAINYYSGDLINFHQARIDKIKENMKD